MENYSEIGTDLKQLITPEQAHFYRIIPYQKSEDCIIFLTDSIQNVEDFKKEVELILGFKSQIINLETVQIDRLLALHYSITEQSNFKSRRDRYPLDFVESLVAEAIRLKGSDIHIEPMEIDCRIRIRLNGELQERYKISRNDYLGLVNRIKILSNLDISERRLPQDGRFIFQSDQRQLDMRISIIPTLRGEKIVMRLLGADASNLIIDDLGFSEIQLKSYREGLKRTKGIILISGPTGSGKTTTLYATLKLLNSVKKNILTVEDPVEYTLAGINQVQAKFEIGLGFSHVLRSFLRQDPDIIMLGEIRDEETAKIAIRLALTGHLVLSTIHTNSGLGTISRLIDMGVPSYLIADTLLITIAQRLVKKLCNHCKKQEKFDVSFLPQNFQPQNIPDFHFTAVGCKNCLFTGFSERIAVYELIDIDSSLANLIRLNTLSSFSFQSKNIRDIKSNAYQLFIDGSTSLEEIYSILID